MTVHPASPKARDRVVLGVLGGSGLYEMSELREVEHVNVSTPFGTPSGPYTVGVLPRCGGQADVRVVFLPRHGPGHRLLPAEINYRANVHGLKQLGVTHVLSVSAVGSLQQPIAPGHFVCVDQFLDRTQGRASTFFGDGAAAHVQFGQPTDDGLRERVHEAARSTGAPVHVGGVCVVMQGPAFSTRAESNFYRGLGAHVIGMTALPEAKLVREAEMAYALLAMTTDYDCWSDDEVSVDAVMAVMAQNVERARATIVALARELPQTTEELPYPHACAHALMTAPDKLAPEVRARLDLIIGHYLTPKHSPQA